MALTVWENVTVSGQYAGLVASSWKGQTYLRSAPAKVNNNSPKQQNHKALYKFAYDLISPAYEKGIKPFFNPPKMTATNAIVKAQTSTYWKYPILSTNAYNVLFNLFRFPLSDININVNAPFHLIGGTSGYYEFTDFEITGIDADKIIQWNMIGRNQKTKEVIFTYGTINNPPIIINPKTYYVQAYIYFCTANNISQLYMLANGNARPTQ